MLKVSRETVKELCELNLEIKRLKGRYEYLSSLAKKAFANKFPEDSVNEEIELNGYKIQYIRNPKRVYDMSLVDELPRKLIKEITTLSTTKVEKLLSCARLTPRQCQNILSARKFDGFNERLHTKTNGEQIRKTSKGKKKDAKISTRVSR